MNQIGQGRTADVIEHTEGNVLKLYKKGFSRETINQEFKISQYVASLGVRTPQAYEIIELDHRLGIIYKRVFGSSMLRVMMAEIWNLNTYSRQLADLHHDLHTHQVNEVLDKQKQVLCNQIEHAPLLSEEEKKKIIHYLEGLQDDDKLCHGDFHPDNVLMDSKGNWAIDWMNGMSGNPAGDVARSVILFSYGTLPEGTSKLVNTVLNFIRSRIKKVYIHRYLEISKMQYSEIDQWILPVAAARLVEGLPNEEKENLLKEIKERLKGIS